MSIALALVYGCADPNPGGGGLPPPPASGATADTGSPVTPITATTTGPAPLPGPWTDVEPWLTVIPKSQRQSGLGALAMELRLIPFA